MGFRDGNFVLAVVRERLRAACESTGSSDLWWWVSRAAFAVRHADQSSLTRRKLQIAKNLLSDTKATSEPQPCDELLCDDAHSDATAKDPEGGITTTCGFCPESRRVASGAAFVNTLHLG